MSKTLDFSKINLCLIKLSNAYHSKRYLKHFYLLELLALDFTDMYFSKESLTPLLLIGFARHNHNYLSGENFEITHLGQDYLKFIFGSSLEDIKKITINLFQNNDKFSSYTEHDSNLRNSLFNNSVRYFNNLVTNHKSNELERICIILNPLLHDSNLSILNQTLNEFHPKKSCKHNFYNLCNFIRIKTSKELTSPNYNSKDYLTLKVSTSTLCSIDINPIFYYLKVHLSHKIKNPKFSTKGDMFKFLIRQDKSDKHSYFVSPSMKLKLACKMLF